MASELQPWDENTERIWSHVLVEWAQIDPLYQPISASSRIKYQCIALSKRYIALGTNIGAIYVFKRETMQYIDMITTDKEGQVLYLAFSPDDNVLAYATSKGNAVILELRFERRQKPDKLRQTGEHRGCTITAMKWNSVGDKLYIGDDFGKVSVAKISSTLAKKRDLFKLPSELIMRLDSVVIQIDCHEDSVVASTLTKAYLCFTSRQQFKHIGSKPRDGKYGACFFQKPKSENFIIYSARPGSRLWEVDEDGNVLSTHQFKPLLDIPPLPIVKSWSEKVSFPVGLGTGKGPLSTNFIQLLKTGQFLLSYNETSLFVFDPIEDQVLLWNDQVTEIHQVVTYNQEIYILFDNNKIQKLELIPVAKLIAKLFSLHNFSLCARVSIAFRSTLLRRNIRRYVPLTMIDDLKQQLEDENDTELASNLENIIQDIKGLNEIDDCDGGSSKPEVSFDKLESGIYMLRQRSVSEVTDSSEKEKCLKTIDERDNNMEQPKHTIEKESTKLNAEAGVVEYEQKSEPTKINQIYSKNINTAEEDNTSRGSANLSRNQSSESLVSLNSLSSNELVFGAPGIVDPEPVYLQTKSVRKLKGRKAKVTSIDLDTTSKDSRFSERKIKRSQSTSVLDTNSPGPPRKNSTQSADTILTNADEIPESPQNTKDVAKTPIRKTHSFMESHRTVDDYGVSRPILSSYIVPISSPVVKLHGKTQKQNSPESSVEVDMKNSGSPSLSSSTPESSPRFGGLKSVRDRISAGMETVGTSVGSKTKSLIQSLKDKTEQLKNKHTDLVEPADVAEKAFDTTLDESNESSSTTTGYHHPDKFPDVDTTKLEEATKQAKEQLDDLGVQFSPKAASKVLTQWVLCLNETLQELHNCMLQQNVDKLKEAQLDLLKESEAVENLQMENKEISNCVPETVWDTENESEFHSTSKNLHNDNYQGKGCNDECPKQDSISQTGFGSQGIDKNDVDIDSSDISAICNIIESTIHLYNPYNINSEMYGDMVDLAVLCLQHRVHGHPSKYTRPTGTALEAVTNTYQDEQNGGSDKVKPNDGHKMTEEVVPRSSEEEMGTLLRSHFYLFSDRIDSVMETIENAGSRNDVLRDALINSLTEFGSGDTVSKHISDGNIQVAFDVLRSGPTQERKCLWSHIKKLFILYPNCTLDFCCELSNEISPPLVQYLCRNSDSPLGYLLYYYKQRLSSVPQFKRSEILMDFCHDEQSRMTLFEALLKEGTEDGVESKLHCTCGQPRPGSHKIKWKEHAQLDSVLSSKDSYTMKVLQLCKTHGYWLGYMKLLKVMALKDELLKVIVQLSDVALLDNKAHSPLEDCSEVLEKLLQLKKCQHSSFNKSDLVDTLCCIYCNTEISDLSGMTLTFEGLAVYLVKQLGPRPALILLRKAELPEGQISLEFYKNCVLAASLDTQRRLVVHNMLEKLSTHLWSVKPNSIPAQVQAAVEHERNVEDSAMVEPLFSKLQKKGAIHRSVEEQEVHWGTVIDLQAFCLACFLSIQEEVTNSDRGVLVFKCGHMFHKRCFSGRNCIVCTT